MGTRQVVTEVGRTVVMSVHPRFADRLMDGSKRVEFRKRPLAADVTHVFVYSTAPVSAVVGVFSVEDQHTLSPDVLWRRFRDVAGIGYADFMAYYAGCAAGTGIAVDQVFVPVEPLRLRNDLQIRHPPQNFQYVGADTARRAFRMLRPMAEPEPVLV